MMAQTSKELEDIWPSKKSYATRRTGWTSSGEFKINRKARLEEMVDMAETQE